VARFRSRGSRGVASTPCDVFDPGRRVLASARRAYLAKQAPFGTMPCAVRAKRAAQGCGYAPLGKHSAPSGTERAAYRANRDSLGKRRSTYRAKSGLHGKEPRRNLANRAAYRAMLAARREQMSVRPLSVLLFEARRALHMNRQDIGQAIGWSYRTIVRWEGRQTDVYSPSLLKIVPRVHAVDPQLAAEIAMACGSSLARLGIGAAPAPNVAAAPQQAPVSVEHLADSVACAAADAMHAAPEAVRPALLAAFRRARELGMTFDDVENAMAQALAPKATKAKTRA
jgi:hypothetical protein